MRILNMAAVSTLFLLYLPSNTMASTNGKKLTNVNDTKLANATWKDDDWIMTKMTSGKIDGAFSTRWADFITKFAKSIHLNLTGSVSFSVWQVGSLIFHVSGITESEEIRVKESNLESLTNYTLLLEEEMLHIVQNEHLICIKNISDVKPNQVTVKASNFTEWRIPDYLVRVAHHPSQQSSVLTIPPTGRGSIILHTSLCTNCILNISVQIEKSNVETYIIRPTLNAVAMNKIKLNFWQEVVIDINPDKEVKLVFTREIIGGNANHLFWNIDYKLAHYRTKEIEHAEEATRLTVEIAAVIGLTIFTGVGVLCITLLYIRKRKIKKAPDDQNMQSHELLIA